MHVKKVHPMLKKVLAIILKLCPYQYMESKTPLNIRKSKFTT